MSGYADPDRQMVVELYVRNIKESIEFYRTPPSNPVGHIRILDLNVDDYWFLSQKLGIPAIRPIENRYYGLRDLTIAGPDGMGLRFATPISDLKV